MSMKSALKTCNACGRRIYKGARTCPQCGKTRTSWNGVVIAILIGIAAGWMMFARGCAKNAETSDRLERMLQSL
jgi:hypothetical protein